MADVVKHVTIRIPEDLHKKLVKLADIERRSINGQVLACIEKCAENIRPDGEKERQEAGGDS